MIQALQRECKEIFGGEPIMHEGKQVPAPSVIPWYPDNKAWYFPIPRHELRKLPSVKRLQEFLIQENEQGNLNRQEAVSMIPPVLLDVNPSHTVLDMCAAPGSKTGQILDFLHDAGTDKSCEFLFPAFSIRAVI